jgi:cytosine/adenosine deaminase-related metal-dependent hydrolase
LLTSCLCAALAAHEIANRPRFGGNCSLFRSPARAIESGIKAQCSGSAEGGSPPYAIRAATINAAELLSWQDKVGALEVNHFADVIAVEGDPLKEITEVQKVKFVMKGGVVVKDEMRKAPQK